MDRDNALTAAAAVAVAAVCCGAAAVCISFVAREGLSANGFDNGRPFNAYLVGVPILMFAAAAYALRLAVRVGCGSEARGRRWAALIGIGAVAVGVVALPPTTEVVADPQVVQAAPRT